MNVRMNIEFLAPGMYHAEEANLCAEVSRIASDFEKGFGTGASTNTPLPHAKRPPPGGYVQTRLY